MSTSKQRTQLVLLLKTSVSFLQKIVLKQYKDTLFIQVIQNEWNWNRILERLPCQKISLLLGNTRKYSQINARG